MVYLNVLLYFYSRDCMLQVFVRKSCHFSSITHILISISAILLSSLHLCKQNGSSCITFLICLKYFEYELLRRVLLSSYWPAWHGVPVVRDVEEFSEVVSPADQRQLDAEMVEQQHLETSPLFLPGLWFVLNVHIHTKRRFILSNVILDFGNK